MTIVNQYSVVEGCPIWLILLVGLCCVVSGVVTVLALVDCDYGIAIWVGTLFIFFLGSIFFVSQGRKTNRTRYECLIDDTTPFVEVAENYDVVSQRGDLWILEDKDEH